MADVVCPWQVFHKEIHMYEMIKAGGVIAF